LDFLTQNKNPLCIGGFLDTKKGLNYEARGGHFPYKKYSTVVLTAGNSNHAIRIPGDFHRPQTRFSQTAAHDNNPKDRKPLIQPRVDDNLLDGVGENKSADNKVPWMENSLMTPSTPTPTQLESVYKLYAILQMTENEL